MTPPRKLLSSPPWPPIAHRGREERRAAGSVWQAFALCDPGQTPAADDCVAVTQFNADRNVITSGVPAFVRFEEVTGHFSTFAVVLLESASVNAPPTVAIAGPAAGVCGQPLSFSFSATDPDPADQAASFTYDIDWDGNSSKDETAVGPAAGVTLQHQFHAAGNFMVLATASDQNGATSEPATHTVQIHIVVLGGGDLHVGGTTGRDSIGINPGRCPGCLMVQVNRDRFGPFTTTSRIVVFGGSGDDFINVNDRITLAVIEHGRNVLIGGLGSDKLAGEGGHDLLVSGTTDFDANDAALAAILIE